MENSTLIVTLIGITIFISLLLAVFLLTVKTENSLSNRLFACFILLTAIDSGGFLLNAFAEGPSNLAMFRSLLIFCQLPVFYLYVLSETYTDFRLQLKHLTHILPLLVANLILIPRFYAVDTAAKLSFLQNIKSMFEIQFNHAFLHIQIAFYLILIFTLIKRSKKLYLENYAGASLASFNWLFQFTMALSIFFGVALLKNIFKFSAFSSISEWLKIGLYVLEIIIISWYLFKALSHPELFRKIDSKLRLVKDLVNEATPRSANNADIIKLKEYMNAKKPFLNPSLTIQNISSEIGIPVRELSLLINHTLGQHFFDFVNTYRIEYTKNILQDPTKKEVTILEILYEAGFNSKSSFNTAFKKHTGFTPTAFRKSL